MRFTATATLMAIGSLAIGVMAAALPDAEGVAGRDICTSSVVERDPVTEFSLTCRCLPFPTARSYVREDRLPMVRFYSIELMAQMPDVFAGYRNCRKCKFCEAIQYCGCQANLPCPLKA